MKKLGLFFLSIALAVIILTLVVSAAEIVTEGTNYKNDGVTASFTWFFDPDSGKLTITWVNGGAWYNDTQGFGEWKAAHFSLVKSIEVDGACQWSKLPLDKSTTGMFEGYPNLVSIWFKKNSTCYEIGANPNSYGIFSDNPLLTTVCTTSTYKEGVIDLSGVKKWTGTDVLKNIFEGCTSITNVIFTDVPHETYHPKLAENMFLNCTSLLSVKLSRGTTVINETAFSGCSSSLMLYAPDADTYAAAVGTGLEAVIDLRGTDIDDFLFKNEYDAQIFVCLSESYEYTSEELLDKFGKNTSYYVHPTSSGVKAANKLFSENNALYVNYYPFLPRDGKETVGSKYEWTFDEATGTVTVSTRYNTTTGGEFFMSSSSNAFYNWKTIWRDAIVRIQIAGNPLWGKMQFQSSSAEGAFENLPNLEAVLMTPNCKQWAISTGGLFENCASLTTFDFGTSWDSIETGVIDLSGVTSGINSGALNDMFKGCVSISAVKLGNGSIKLIGSNMFSGCVSLEKFVIGSNITSIGSYAFADCTSLKCVTLENESLIISDPTVFPDKENFYVLCPNSESADAITNAYELSVGITLEGIISSEGFQIRFTDYNGLRSVFSVDRKLMNKLEDSGFKMAEFGALIASESEYNSREGAYLGKAGGEYITNASAIKKVVVFDGNDFVGKILSSSDEKKTNFAVTIVNFKNNFKSNIYSCVYAVIKDTYGNEYFIYSDYGDINADYKFINLYDTTIEMLKDDTNVIHSAKIDVAAVWNTVMQGAVKLGDSYENAVNESVSLSLVRDGDGYLGFVRAADKAMISESDIEECNRLINDEYTVSKLIKVSVAGEIVNNAPVEDPVFPYPQTITLAPKYNREEDQAQHCQGFCTDGEYMYYSLTGFIVKTDMEGNEVGRVHAYNNENGNPGLHIGDPAYHDGKIYIPINYMWWGVNLIGVIDTDAFVDSDPDTDGIQPVGREAINILYTPEIYDSKFKVYEGDTVSAIKYRISGCDGVAVGKLPGSGYIDPVSGDEVEDNNHYVILSMGIVLDHSNIYYDDDYKIFYAYDISDIESKIINIDEISSNGVGMEQNAKYVFRVYTGASQYGVQSLDYDDATGDYFLWCYARPNVTEFPAQNLFVIDGSKKLYMDEIEVGQSVGENSLDYAKASATAALHADENGNYPCGYMATLKCICGKGDIEAHDAVCYGETDYAVKICGKNESLGGSQGFIYIGNDYCYIGKLLDSKDENGYTIFGTSANLYRLKNRLGNWEFSKVVK